MKCFSVYCAVPRALVVGAEVLGVDIPLGLREWWRSMEPRLVFDGAENLIDGSVEDWSFYLSGVDWEVFLVVELLILPKSPLVLILPWSS